MLLLILPSPSLQVSSSDDDSIDTQDFVTEDNSESVHLTGETSGRLAVDLYLHHNGGVGRELIAAETALKAVNEATSPQSPAKKKAKTGADLKVGDEDDEDNSNGNTSTDIVLGRSAAQSLDLDKINPNLWQKKIAQRPRGRCFFRQLCGNKLPVKKGFCCQGCKDKFSLNRNGTADSSVSLRRNNSRVLVLRPRQSNGTSPPLVLQDDTVFDAVTLFCTSVGMKRSWLRRIGTTTGH